MAALKRFALAYLRNPAAGLGLLLLIGIIAMALTGCLRQMGNKLRCICLARCCC